MKMAKATQEEIDRAVELVNLLQETADIRSFEFPTRSDTGDQFDPEEVADLAWFYKQVKKLCPGLMRVVFGYQVLVDNCCNPDADTLEWKKGITIPEEES